MPHTHRRELKCPKCEQITSHTRLGFYDEIDNTLGSSDDRSLRTFGTLLSAGYKFFDHKTFGLASKLVNRPSEDNYHGYKCDVCGLVVRVNGGGKTFWE
jgi:hypothetical protein